ncbi:MAG: hypothetical protein GY833_13525 [Aestuariibacter sp.]|nr:hypothetical protein [Aestuariibacter sp.]
MGYTIAIAIVFILSSQGSVSVISQEPHPTGVVAGSIEDGASTRFVFVPDYVSLVYSGAVAPSITVDEANDTYMMRETNSINPVNAIETWNTNHNSDEPLKPHGDLDNVTIDGPTTGVVRAIYTFTATVRPNTAWTPIEYVWEASGQAAVVTTTNDLSHTVPYSWSVAGTYAITVTATNSINMVTSHYSITIGVSPLTSVTINGPTEGFVQAPYVFTAVGTPSTATRPITYTWSPEPTMGQGFAMVTYIWNRSGNQAITVTAKNGAKPVTDTHIIDIAIVPLETVSITGTTQGYANASCTFTATVSPISATEPITYVWYATGQSGVAMHTSGDLSNIVSFTWSMPDDQTIIVTATNSADPVTAVHHVNIVIVPVKSVDIIGATQGDVSTPYTFTAIVAPISATEPITYIWYATEQGDVVIHTSGGLSDTVPFSWGKPGIQTIIVTATNGVVEVTDIHIINVAPLDSINITGTMNGNVNISYTFTATVNPVTTTGPITYFWYATGQSNVLTPTSSGLSDTMPFAWSIPGLQTIVVTATNGTTPITDAHYIDISIVPVKSVEITDTTTGYANISYTFTATVTPILATEPVTYVWYATGQSGRGPYTGGLSDTVSFTWNISGTQTIVVTATNGATPITDAHHVDISIVPVKSVEITGTTTGYTNIPYTFTATVTPILATEPVTYVWYTKGQSGRGPYTGGLSDTVSFTWSASGTRTIIIMATNPGSTVTSTHNITIELFRIYLPVIMRCWPPIKNTTPILNATQPEDNESYTVSWDNISLAEFYDLQEVVVSSGVTRIYRITNTTSYTTTHNRCIEQYSYSVKACNNSCNNCQCTNWSSTQSVNVRWECEPNDSCSQTSGPLISGQNYYGYHNDEWDCFEVNLPTGWIRMTLLEHNTSCDDVELRLYAPPRKQVCIDDKSPYDMVCDEKKAGTYYLCVYTGGGYDSTTPYTLRAIFPKPKISYDRLSSESD